VEQIARPEAGPGTRWNELELETARLYQEYAAGLLRYAATLARSQDGAGDAVQETFLRYFVERRCGRIVGQPRAWLYQVLRNYLLDRLKTSASKQEVVSQDIDDLPDLQQDPEEQLARRQMTRQFAAALTDRELDCLRLRGAGLSYGEIAGVMGIREGTVGAFMARVHRKLEQAAGEKAVLRLGTEEAIRSLFLGADA